MKNKKLLSLITIFLAAGLLVFLVYFARTAVDRVSLFLQEARVLTYAKLSFIGNFVSTLNGIAALTGENIELKEENKNLLSLLASQAELEEENYFLREALNLPTLEERKLHEAEIFDFQFTPDGYSLFINKGESDGIEKGLIVITSSGILVGAVDEVFKNYSRVVTVTNLKFKVTIKILLKNISGIANGASKEGVFLDFISQNDEVIEGDMVVTSGTDIFPPGLIVGKISRVSSNSGNLFKDVKVEPTMTEVNLSRVLIIGQ